MIECAGHFDSSRGLACDLLFFSHRLSIDSISDMNSLIITNDPEAESEVFKSNSRRITDSIIRLEERLREIGCLLNHNEIVLKLYER